MNNKIKKIWLIVIVALMYLPIILLAINSFNEAKYGVVWQGFTWKWYEKLFNHKSLINATLNSFSLSFISANVVCILGLVIAFTLFRYNFKAKNLVQSLLLIVLNSPDLIMGVSLLILFIALKIELGMISLLISHITFCLPYVVIIIYSSLRNFDQSIINAAKDLGASEKQILWNVLIPISLPAIISSWIVSFTLSMDDMIVSSFVSGPSYEILPIKIYSMLKTGLSPEINALTTIMLLISGIIITNAHIAARSIAIKKERK